LFRAASQHGDRHQYQQVSHPSPFGGKLLLNRWVDTATIRVRVSIAFNRLLQIPGATVTEVVIAARDVEVTPLRARLLRSVAVRRWRRGLAGVSQAMLRSTTASVDDIRSASSNFVPPRGRPFAAHRATGP
jgi:hypothetical protein